MDNSSDPPVRSTTDPTTTPPRAHPSESAVVPNAAVAPARVRGGRTRLPSFRASAALAVAMLTVGVGVGAAIGPAPASSLAGSGDVVQKLPALIASIAARARAQAAQTPAQTASTTTKPPAVKRQATPAATSTTPASTATPTSATTTTPAAESETKSSTPTKSSGGSTSKVPPITSVWLIELAGGSFAEPLANIAAAPYINGQLVPKGTLLSGWSALSASAFASDAALVEHKAAVGGTPPVLHTIVQPPCPEGPTGATCLTGTPGALTAADQFLQATLASITTTTTYSEHGLVVVTFATVADPASVELPAGASSATLASTPPAGAVLLSPFAKAGARSTVAFNPTSPKQSLEKLLH
jgi:hypothetical protein